MNTRSQWRHRLISEHAEVARRIALKMARRCPDWVAREDLIAAGMLGLTEAAERYDESRTEPFLSFAEHRIRGAVLDELRRGDMLPRRVRQLARRISNTIRSLENRGVAPSEERIAEDLGVPVEHYRSGLSHLVNVGVDPIGNDDQILVSDQRQAPDELAAHRQLVATVRTALGQLEPRDVTILGLHYLEDLTYQQIAETLRITPSRVCQLLWRAVERLRTRLGEQTMQEAA
ncbi:MAG: sigma-70 family RNA polymerase sigma factor [Deltaproteobacteria bacterium]|nr:MAG: sigma-70 family RNA polymerase sigma factor [Deltaproteobacteria bacterium]